VAYNSVEIALSLSSDLTLLFSLMTVAVWGVFLRQKKKSSGENVRTIPNKNNLSVGVTLLDL
jgi:hypothetical protein